MASLRRGARPSGTVVHRLLARSASTTATPPLPCQRELFDLPDDICYLNAAYMGPTLKSSAAIWAAGAAAKSTPWALSKESFYEDRQAIRRSFAALVGATANDIAIQASSSYGAATAAANVAVEAGQNIVTLGGEHTSNRFIWQQLADEQGLELRVVAPPCPSQPAGAWSEAVLAQIDSATAVTAVVPNYWLDGTMIDLAAVSERCHEVDSALVVDGTQSVGKCRLESTYSYYSRSTYVCLAMQGFREFRIQITEFNLRDAKTMLWSSDCKPSPRFLCLSWQA